MIIARNEQSGLGMLEVMNLLNDSAANEETDAKTDPKEKDEK